MDLDVADLAARGLSLSWDGPGGRERRIALSPSEGVTGTYSIDPTRHRIDAGTDAALVLAEVAWPLTEGRLQITGDVPLARLALDLWIGRGEESGTKGEVGVASLSAPAIELEHPSFGTTPLRLAGLSLDEAALAFDGQGGMAFVASSAEIDRLTLRLGTAEIALESVALTGIKIRRLNDVWILTVSTVTADLVRIERGALSLQGAGLELRRLERRAGDLMIGDVSLGELALDQPDLRGGDEAEPEPPQSKGARREPLDLTALDKLSGKIDLDLTADTVVPVVGARRATHHFRLRVDHGAINYYRLEKSLSALEDALLDFKVKDRKLLLVADVPFLPLSKKTIVSWPLPDAEELDLAERHLVRIRRLLDYRLRSSGSSSRSSSSRASSAKTNDKKSFAVRELRFDGIDVGLRWSGGDRLPLPGGGELVLGSANRPAISDLSVTGGIRYADTSAPAGGLEVAAERIRLGLEALPLGGRSLDLARIAVDRLAATVPFAGVAPRSASIRASGLRLRDLALRTA